MNKIPFYKYSGAGNDFILIDENKFPDFKPDARLIKQMCNRNTGIGADGILLISDSENYDFAMRYFNADGSEGFLCANGARCSVKYAEMSGRISGKANFTCCGKTYTASINTDGSVTLNLPDAEGLQPDIAVPVENRTVNAPFIDTGARHVVINAENVFPENGNLSPEQILENMPVFELGRKLRYLPQFEPEGVNVNFVIISDGKIFIRTYEKGVENETLACGTGAVAAALISFLQKKIKTPVEIIPKSRDRLIVNFDYIIRSFKNISLTGPAELIFAGDYINKQK